MTRLPDRILVYGVTGSGKSTLAEQIAHRTGLPLHRVDELTWEPGWVEVPADEQRRRVAEICADERWILDSAYSKWLDIVLAHVDVIVALDYPRRVSLARLVRRTTVRLVNRQVVCNGNRETLRRLFSRESIIGWHFRSFPAKRGRIRAWADDKTSPPVIRLASPAQTRSWLNGIEAGR